MANYLGGLKFQRKDFNSEIIANAIAKQIKCSKKGNVRCRLTKEGYEWFSLMAHINIIREVVDNLFGDEQCLRFTVRDYSAENDGYHMFISWGFPCARLETSWGNEWD